MIILPIGLKLPLDPVDYLKQSGSDSRNEYVNAVIQNIRELHEDKVHDTIIVGFDVFTASVKKVENADLVAAIDQENGDVRLAKTIRVTDDPSAPAFRIEPDLPPLTFRKVYEKIKAKRPDIKMDNSIMNEIKANSALCQARYLDPKIKTGTKKYFYSEKAVDEFIKIFDDKAVTR